MRVSPVLCWRLSPKLTVDHQFVPAHQPVHEAEIRRLQEFLLSKPATLVLTGAGISTESGIPDYRSAGVGLYARRGHKPIQHPEFVRSEAVRKRYWARNFIGWDSFSRREPNAVHHALARFEREGRISGIVTQNVDRLHTKSGSKQVVEMHGSGYEVGCLSCDYTIDRHEFQAILTALNPEFTHEARATMIRPDGDVDISPEKERKFVIPPCPQCETGFLKPKIVFFGDNIPGERINQIVRWVTESDAVLVLGSSLTVFSGYRIVLQAKELGIPVVIVNIGETRGDGQADLKISAKCGDVVPKLFIFDKK